MKATALGDKIYLEAENASDNATIKLVTRGMNVTMLSNGVEYRANGTAIESLTIGAGSMPMTDEQRVEKYLDDLERDLGQSLSPTARRVLRWAHS